MTVTPEAAAPLGAEALVAVDDGSAPDADAVAWISEHLAALERVVHPAARRLLPGRPELSAQRARTRELERALRRLHQRVSGDGAAMHLPVARLRDDVRARLAEHALGERSLETQLRALLTPAAWDELTARYRRALAGAPTRPHPNAPHAGWPGRLARGVLTQVDRLLDGLDARAVHEWPTGG